MDYKSKNFSKLGKEINVFDKPDINILEKVENPKKNVLYTIRFTCPEFTSICPVTSQPDFANIILDYIPKKFIVESKSFKLYLQSYRNHGAFHEDCTISIALDIVNKLNPIWLRIAGYWYPRGGIPIDIFWQTSEAPDKVLIPKLENFTYKGRK